MKREAVGAYHIMCIQELQELKLQEKSHLKKVNTKKTSGAGCTKAPMESNINEEIV